MDATNIHVNAISMAKLTRSYKHSLHPKIEELIVTASSKGIDYVNLPFNTIRALYWDDHHNKADAIHKVHRDIQVLRDRGFSVVEQCIMEWDHTYGLTLPIDNFYVSW